VFGEDENNLECLDMPGDIWSGSGLSIWHVCKGAAQAEARRELRRRHFGSLVGKEQCPLDALLSLPVGSPEF
jgi:hypothetical protein